ncbi:MAG TPA: signal peptidase I, partial [Anaerolineae bacterium]|nr:signal peptidase I [Anaerolineae bacterium]
DRVVAAQRLRQHVVHTGGARDVDDEVHDRAGLLDGADADGGLHELGGDGRLLGGIRRTPPLPFLPSSLPFSLPFFPGRIWGRTPERGDVVVFKHPLDETDYIKRVIGLPGEVIEVRDGHALIDGLPLDEPYVTYFGGPSYPPTRIPEDCVFVMGDNRPNSRDSRHIGPVPIDTIRGHALFIYWPLQRVQEVP